MVTFPANLYQVGEEGSFSIVAHKKLSYASDGMGSTDPQSVPEGKYLASVTLGYPGGDQRQFNSPVYFQVKKVDEKYEVTPEGDGGEDPGQGELEERHPEGDREDGEMEETSLPFCDHVFEYSLVKQATAQCDSVLARQCTKCGAVAQYIEVPNSAYAAFLAEAIDTIRNTHTEEAIIRTDRWISFNQAVIEAIAERPELSVTVVYKYQGVECSVMIPAGADVRSLLNENGYCGFRYLDSVFGGK